MRNRMMILMSALALVGSLGLAACGGNRSSTVTKTLTATDILTNAKAAKMQSFEFTLTATASDGTVTGTGKAIDSPYRMAMDMLVKISGTTVPVSIVEDDMYQYTKDPVAGTWSKTPNTDTSLKSDLTSFDLNNPTLIGKEAVNGVDAYHLTGTDKDGNPQDYWFRADNFYLIQGTFSSKGSSPMSGKMTITAWNTNPTIDIPQVAG